MVLDEVDRHSARMKRTWKPETESPCDPIRIAPWETDGLSDLRVYYDIEESNRSERLLMLDASSLCARKPQHRTGSVERRSQLDEDGTHSKTSGGSHAEPCLVRGTRRRLPHCRHGSRSTDCGSLADPKRRCRDGFLRAPTRNSLRLSRDPASASRAKKGISSAEMRRDWDRARAVKADRD